MSNADLIVRLLIAVALSGAIGLEREVRQKHAGLRTHALVGLGSALIIEVSAYGFADVLVPGKVELDPSRVAAQVVSGIGFIGAGLIFVRQEYVRGLTTAASIWLTAAVGLAAGAGMWEIALAGAVLGLVVVEGLEILERIMRLEDTPPVFVRVTYLESNHAAFHRIVAACEQEDGAAVADVQLRRHETDPPTVSANFQLHNALPRPALAHELLALGGVVEVSVDRE